MSDDTKLSCQTTQNLVGRHQIRSDDTKFGLATQNCHVGRHKTVMSDDTKLSCRTTQNCHVGRHKTVMSYDQKNVHGANTPLPRLHASASWIRATRSSWAAGGLRRSGRRPREAFRPKRKSVSRGCSRRSVSLEKSVLIL
jgi:hypothetical protein